MMKAPVSDERDQIKARINIVELVEQRVALKRTGKHYTGLCPFHDDKRPSFTVMPDSGYYRCYACGAKGDIFDWVMHDRSVDFAEALRILAARAGVELRARNPEQASQRARQLEAMQCAQAFFVTSLAQSPLALGYCDQRGLDAEVRAAWGLGYSPAEDHALASHLRKSGFSLADCRELFLVEDDGTGGFFDKFRGRLMFPIHDDRGDLVAFGGRVIGDAHPKYINSSDTPLYRKSRVLYGLNRANQAIVKSRRAVLVEGYLDVIACHRAGVEVAVASLGTAMSEEQAKLLKRRCEQVTVLYDRDAAGEKAAARASEILAAEGLGVRIALMPEGEDPDTLLRASGPDAVQRAASGGLSALEFAVMRLEQEIDPREPQFWQQVVEVLAACPSPPEIEAMAARLAAKYLPGGREGQVIRLLQQVRAQQRQKLRGVSRPQRAAQPASLAPSELPSSELAVLRAFMEEELRELAHEALKSGLVASLHGRPMAAAILAAFPAAAPQGQAALWLDRIEPDTLRDQLVDWTSGGVAATRALPLRDRPPVSLIELEDAIGQLLIDLDSGAVAHLREGADEQALIDANRRLRAAIDLHAQRVERTYEGDTLEADPETDVLFREARSRLRQRAGAEDVLL